jgi:uncharacterized protein YbjT (DUF2867 family)
MKSQIILITGAAGKTGRAVIRALLQRGVTVRAAVRREAQRAALESLGAHETVVFDLEDQAAFENAARGIRALYHICPNVHPQELAIGRSAIRAAQKAEVGHLVYHSVLWPQIEAMPHHWQKMRVEEALVQSGLPFTILQPCAYMQNSLAQLENMRSNGIFEVPYRVQARFSLVDLEDVAEAAARILTEPGHNFAVYACCGPEAISSIQQAECFSRALGTPIEAKAAPLAEWQASATAAGVRGYSLQALIQMFRYYDRHNFVGSPVPLANLLERDPNDFENFLACSLN